MADLRPRNSRTTLYGQTYEPGFPIWAVFRLKGQPKRDSGIIFGSCKASQSPVYPIRDAILGLTLRASASRGATASLGLRLTYSGGVSLLGMIFTFQVRSTLLPAALQEWLPDDHLAYFISDVVDQLGPWPWCWLRMQSTKPSHRYRTSCPLSVRARHLG